MSLSKPTGVKHLVVGGSGFLGSNILAGLVKRGETNVYNVDLREPQSDMAVDGVAFHAADITQQDSVNKVIEAVKPDIVYHTASPAAIDEGHSDLMEKVNVQGTENIIAACQRYSVRFLVFTSSGNVIFEGKDLINVDERMPYPEKAYTKYNDTKKRAEQRVLAANTDEGTDGLKTVAIRPSGIFGPHDRQMIPNTIRVLKTRKHNVQIGDNTNLFDFTYVENIVHAHLLAADKLLAGAKPYPRDLLATVHLAKNYSGISEKPAFIDRDVPSSAKRKDVSGATDYARQLPVSGTKIDETTLDIRPVVRNKFDQFFHVVNPDIASGGNPIPDVISIAEDSVKVAGEVFIITNNQPLPFWDTIRAIWEAYEPGSVQLRKVWHIPAELAGVLAYSAEWYYYLAGIQNGSFDRFKVMYSTATRYFNIEKARRALGYEPLYSVEEGIRRSVAWYKEAERKGQFAAVKA